MIRKNVKLMMQKSRKCATRRLLYRDIFLASFRHSYRPRNNGFCYETDLKRSRESSLKQKALIREQSRGSCAALHQRIIEFRLI